MVHGIVGDAAGVRPAVVQGDTSSTSAHGKAGQYRGQAVQLVQQSQSLLGDAVEEISIFVGERTAHERDAKKKIKDALKENKLKETDMIQQVMGTIQDPNLKKRLQNFIQGKNLLSRGGQGGLAELTARVQRQFQDVSEQYLALAALEKDLEHNGGDKALLTNVRTAKDNLMKAQGTAVRAGLNVTPRALNVANGDAEHVQALRETYRDTVVGYKGLKHVYDNLLERFGNKDIRVHADFLIKAAGDDLASQGPSLRGVALKEVIDDLYHLETLVTLHAGCEVSLEHMRQMSSSFDSVTAGTMMSRVLALASEEWPDAQSLSDMTRDLHATSPNEEINVLREVRHLVERLPEKIYVDHENRTRLIDVIKQAQDDAVAREEDEWFE
ncbi:MAG: type III secretion system gatekeeper subunit SctW [Alphaproteobacteria bacterium GM202ARS2]|nr:type III secretion system gatekeeper subunit SctW [Alphaproteobacteria bacterium GM202ARS2]